MSHSLVSVLKKKRKKRLRMTKRAIRRIRKKKMTWLTFTSDSTNVKVVSHGTFTAERAVCVNALAINTRTIDAFVNIYNQKCQHRLKLNATTITEILKNADLLSAYLPFGCSSGPRWYPSLGQRSRYPSGTVRCQKSSNVLITSLHEYEWFLTSMCFAQQCLFYV